MLIYIHFYNLKYHHMKTLKINVLLLLTTLFFQFLLGTRGKSN
jgi:hypothetical protein